MQKKKLLLTAIAYSLLFLFGCKTANKQANSLPVATELVRDESFRKVTKDKELYAATNEVIPVDSVFITKDTLHVFTPVIQACDADNLRLIWNGSMAKSLPPQATLKLLLTNDPTCKENHPFHLTYNIAMLRGKSEWTDSISTLIKIFGLKSGVLYRF